MTRPLHLDFRSVSVVYRTTDLESNFHLFLISLLEDKDSVLSTVSGTGSNALSIKCDHAWGMLCKLMIVLQEYTSIFLQDDILPWCFHAYLECSLFLNILFKHWLQRLLDPRTLEAVMYAETSHCPLLVGMFMFKCKTEVFVLNHPT